MWGKRLIGVAITRGNNYTSCSILNFAMPDMPFQAVCDFYPDDFNRDLLEAHLLTFGVKFQCNTTSSVESAKPTIFDMRDHFKALSAT